MRALSIFLLLVGMGLPVVTAAAEYRMTGPFAYSTRGSQIEYEIGRLYNLTPGSSSTALRVEIWASETRYTGGLLTGHLVGREYRYGPSGGKYYQDVSGGMTRYDPPDGTYWIVLLITEILSGDVIKDYHTFDYQEHFGDNILPQFPTASALQNGWFWDSDLFSFTLIGQWLHMDFYPTRWYYCDPAGTWDTGMWIWDNHYQSWTYTKKAWFPAIYYSRWNRWGPIGFSSPLMFF